MCVYFGNSPRTVDQLPGLNGCRLEGHQGVKLVSLATKDVDRGGTPWPLDRAAHVRKAPRCGKGE